MNRLIVNPEVISPFLDRLIERHPTHANFINAQIKNYLLKKEKSYVIKHEGHGFYLLFKSLFNKDGLEAKLFKQYGLSGENYYDLNLTENCFKQYSHYLDILGSLNKDTKTISMDRIIQLDFEDTENRRNYLSSVKYYKATTLKEDYDYKLLRQISDKYSIIELLSLAAYRDEGMRMNHCVGRFVVPSPSFKIYSMRDKNDKAIITMKVDLQNKLLEAAGNCNSRPNPQLLDLAIRNLNIDPAHMKTRIEEGIEHNNYKKTFVASMIIGLLIYGYKAFG